MALVGIALAVTVYEIALVASGFSLLDRAGFVTESEAFKWQQSLDSAIGLWILTLIASGVAVLAWLYRVVENVPALGGGAPDTSPGGAVGWWFVPVANLVKPPLIVADAWRRLATQPREVGVALVAAWWILWLGGGFGDRIVAALPAETITDLRNMLALEVLALLAQVASGILLIRVIWEIERRSRIRAAGFAPVAAAPPVISPAEWLTGAAWTASPPDHATPSLAAAAPSSPPPSDPPAVSSPGTGAVAFCPECGTRRFAGGRYCASCGWDLDTVGQAPPS